MLCFWEFQILNIPGYFYFTYFTTGEPYDVIVQSDPDSKSATAYAMSWNAPNDGGEPIQTYYVKYRKVLIYPDRNPDGSYKYKEEDPQKGGMSPETNIGNRLRYDSQRGQLIKSLN